jgi:hypothetical protein
MGPSPEHPASQPRQETRVDMGDTGLTTCKRTRPEHCPVPSWSGLFNANSLCLVRGQEAFRCLQYLGILEYHGSRDTLLVHLPVNLPTQSSRVQTSSPTVRTAVSGLTTPNDLQNGRPRLTPDLDDASDIVMEEVLKSAI